MIERRSFSSVFGSPPEAEGRAFGRVNLLGEHTDYNQGLVLPTAIPQETVVQVAVGNEQEHQAYSADFDRLERFDEQSPLHSFAAYVGGCVRVLAAEGFRIPPLRIWIGSNVPIGAGLSSSAALEVATLRALNARFGLGLDQVTIALLGQRAETVHAGVACGIMDQMASSFAAPGQMLFFDTKTFAQELVPLPPRSEILVVDSGVKRSLATSAYNLRRRECEAAALQLKVPSLRDVTSEEELAFLPRTFHLRARHVLTENNRVVAGKTADAKQFGRLLNESHASLRDDFEVSSPELDRLVERMQELDTSFGAKMTGAGFGGACVGLIEAGSADGATSAILRASAGSPWSIVVPRPGSEEPYPH